MGWCVKQHVRRTEATRPEYRIVQAICTVDPPIPSQCRQASPALRGEVGPEVDKGLCEPGGWCGLATCAAEDTAGAVFPQLAGP